MCGFCADIRPLISNRCRGARAGARVRDVTVALLDGQNLPGRGLKRRLSGLRVRGGGLLAVRVQRLMEVEVQQLLSQQLQFLSLEVRGLLVPEDKG